MACCICTGSGYCGDSKVDAREQCDDGNNIDGDGCSASCLTESNSGILSLAV
jgi:large repetitive protein